MSLRQTMLLCPFVVAVLLGRAFPEPDEPAPDDEGPILEFSMDRYRWEKRPVLLFSPSLGDPNHQHSMTMFERNRPWLDERDVVVIEVPRDGIGRAGGRELPGGTPGKLREAFKIEPDAFVVVLVGKDGTEKRRWTKLQSLKELFETIDAMPMRQQEIRDRPPGAGR